MNKSKAQQIFGDNAEAYANSPVHVRDDSLDIIEKMLAGYNFEMALDVGTGAGFTAISISNISNTVLASDPTRPMLEQTRKSSISTNSANISVIQNIAEQIPISTNTVDLITCRKAGHHFPEFDKYIHECSRILKQKGILIIADSISPENEDLDQWLNQIELERDPSHVRNRKLSEINMILNKYHLKTIEHQLTRIHLSFNSWVGRTGVSKSYKNHIQQKFINAEPDIKEAFQIRSIDDDIHFSWPCVVMKCVKSV